MLTKKAMVDSLPSPATWNCFYKAQLCRPFIVRDISAPRQSKTSILIWRGLSSTRVEKPCRHSWRCQGTFWMPGVHLGANLKFTTNHALFMTNSCQKLANIYQIYLKDTQFHENEFVKKYNNKHTFVAFFSILTQACWGTFLTRNFCQGTKRHFYNPTQPSALPGSWAPWLGPWAWRWLGGGGHIAL